MAKEAVLEGGGIHSEAAVGQGFTRGGRRRGNGRRDQRHDRPPDSFDRLGSTVALESTADHHEPVTFRARGEILKPTITAQGRLSHLKEGCFSASLLGRGYIGQCRSKRPAFDHKMENRGRVESAQLTKNTRET